MEHGFLPGMDPKLEHGFLAGMDSIRSFASSRHIFWRMNSKLISS